MKTIEWSKRALKQFKKIDKQYRKAISEAVDTLAYWPNCRNVKALTNHKYPYRLRVGNYRIFFTAQLKIVFIEEVKKRNERTY